MPVFSVSEDLDAAGAFPLSKEDLHHLRRVLRVKIGQAFTVLLPDGRQGLACLEKLGGKVSGKILEAPLSTDSAAQDSLPASLAIALVRWPRLEWLVEKASELGVAEMLPLTLSQGSRDPKAVVSPAKIARLQKISRESLKQCVRVSGPAIRPPMGLKEYLANQPRGLKIWLDERATATPLMTLLSERGPQEHYSLLIGPEGGFSPKERDLIQAADFLPVTLGAIKFRSETAAIYSLSVLDAFLFSSRGRKA